jgi:hypothetical protein
VVAGDGQLKVCPKCYAMLWHEDYSAEERRIRAERAAVVAAKNAEAHRLKLEAIAARKLARAMHENPKMLLAKSVSTSGPVLGRPTLTENKPDEPEKPSDN